MKKIIALLLISTSLIACKNEKKEAISDAANAATKTETSATEETTNEDAHEAEEKEELPILVGIKTRNDIVSSPYDAWFAPAYATYQVDKTLTDQIKPLTDEVTIKIFMGTWCEDSQREVPHFYKILDALKFDVKRVELITLDEEKQTPDHYEDPFAITNVPTFIFSKDGIEMNRIVESPVISLEQDMLNILSGAAYKHTYAE